MCFAVCRHAFLGLREHGHAFVHWFIYKHTLTRSFTLTHVHHRIQTHAHTLAQMYSRSHACPAHFLVEVEHAGLGGMREWRR